MEDASDHGLLDTKALKAAISPAFSKGAAGLVNVLGVSNSASRGSLANAGGSWPHEALCGCTPYVTQYFFSKSRVSSRWSISKKHGKTIRTGKFKLSYTLDTFNEKYYYYTYQMIINNLLKLCKAPNWRYVAYRE